MGCKWTGENCGLEVWLNKIELFDETSITDVDKFSDGGTGLGKVGLNTTGLIWVGLVGGCEAVKLRRHGGLDGEITHGEIARDGFVGSGHLWLLAESKRIEVRWNVRERGCLDLLISTLVLNCTVID